MCSRSIYTSRLDDPFAAYLSKEEFEFTGTVSMMIPKD